LDAALLVEFIMSRRLLPLITRHEPAGSKLAHLKSGLGAMIGTTLVGGLAVVTGMPMLLAPLGATAVLLFAHPASPLAQPANVLGGYLVAVAITVAAALIFPQAWWIATICVGLVIALMLILRVTHPPAGAVPLLAAATPMAPGTLAGAVMAGAACLLGVALVHHRLPPKFDYPKRLG
jgi:CBS-domain-containing membrane protein